MENVTDALRGCTALQAQADPDRTRVKPARRESIIPRARQALIHVLTRPDLGAQLPIMHRLALLYLLLPFAIWLLTWFKGWIGVPAAALLALAAAPTLAGSWRGRPRPAVWGLLLAALAWVMATAAGGVFGGHMTDWLDHLVMVQALARYPWPAWIPDPLAAYAPEAVSPPLLRYYLGWHIVPGLIGRLGGSEAARWAVPLWTWLGASLALWMFARGYRGWGTVGAAALFVFFSGMDVLRWFLEAGWDWLAVDVGPRGGPRLAARHLLEKTNLIGTVSFISNFYIFRSSPQHGVSAWLGALLLLQVGRHPRLLACSGILLAAVTFWSPFSAVGLLPLGAALLWTRGPRPFLAWPNLGLAGPLAGLVALYLLTGATEFDRAWVWELYEGPALARGLFLLYLTEFGLLALVLAILRPELRRTPFFVASLTALCLLPGYQYGGNHFSIRAALPSLLVLCHYCADVLARPAARQSRFVRRSGVAALLVMLGLGALTGVSLLALMLKPIDPFWYAQAPRITSFELPWKWQRENMEFNPTPALRALLRAPDAARAPAALPGTRVARGAWDIYWEADARRLVYLKRPCDWEAESAATSEFFLQLLPAARADFGITLDTEAAGGGSYGPLNQYVRSLGEACSVTRILPFEPARIRTGQRLRAAGDWSVALARDDTRGLIDVTARDRRAVLHAIDRDVPAAQSVFDVYLAPDAVTLVRARCAAGDADARFFLHTAPWERRNLLAARPAVDFDNLDFHFSGFAVRHDEQCWAIVPLPDYGIRTLRVGQYAAGGDLWRVEVPFAEHVPAALDGLRAAYRATSAREPAVRSVFDVHLVAQDAVFVKHPCRPEDIEAKFILHVTPVRRRHLPAHRWRAGFANLGFSLAGHGGRFDNVCLARIALPVYPIERLRVGQYLSRERRVLWQEDILRNRR